MGPGYEVFLHLLKARVGGKMVESSAANGKIAGAFRHVAGGAFQKQEV